MSSAGVWGTSGVFSIQGCECRVSSLPLRRVLALLLQAQTSADLPSRWGVEGSLQLKQAAVLSAATLVDLQVVSACLDLQETFTARENAAGDSHSNLRVRALTL